MSRPDPPSWPQPWRRTIEPSAAAYLWVRQCNEHPEGPVRWKGPEPCFCCGGPGEPTSLMHTIEVKPVSTLV